MRHRLLGAVLDARVPLIREPRVRYPDPFQKHGEIFEIATVGVDEALQAISSDPYGGSSWVGLRIPTLPTPSQANRYLFQLATFSLGEGERARILGWRQMLTILAVQGGSEGSAPRYVEQLVTTPFWHFQDGDTSFHLQRLGPPATQGLPSNQPAPNDLRNFKYQRADGPALLYLSATVPTPYYVDLTAYVPPNRGRPWGAALGELRTVYDQRTQWTTHGAWGSLDIDVQGPDTVGLFASVYQTNPSTRVALTFPGGVVYPGGVPPEEQFLHNWSGLTTPPVYGRVAGSLIVQRM